MGDQQPRRIEVVPYDPSWPYIFEQLRERIWPAIHDLALTIEHVGSTSVPGLAAKPIIDMDIVVAAVESVPLVIERLKPLGYAHRGNLGIAGREAFASPVGLPEHHLYLCQQDSLALRNHLALRDYLRSHPQAAQAYGALKQRLAAKHACDIDGYVAGKTDLIVNILAESGLSSDALEAIRRANKGTA
jgi:GrpB-like predicted nucleotidyltransferase (UPF0157 family)